MHNRYKKFPIIIRIISFILIVTFLAQDIAWAHPDTLVKPPSDKLAPDTIFHQKGKKELAEGIFIEHLIEKHPSVGDKISLLAISHILELKDIKGWCSSNNITYMIKKTEAGEICEILLAVPRWGILRYFDPSLSQEIEGKPFEEVNPRLFKQRVTPTSSAKTLSTPPFSTEKMRRSIEHANSMHRIAKRLLVISSSLSIGAMLAQAAGMIFVPDFHAAIWMTPIVGSVLFLSASLFFFFKSGISRKRIFKQSLLKLKIHEINDADTLAKTIDRMLLLIRWCKNDYNISIRDILTKPKGYQDLFFNPLYELLFARLGKDFTDAEGFTEYCGKILRREGALELKDRITRKDARIVALFDKIKESPASASARIKLYGLLLFYLSSDKDNLKEENPYLKHIMSKKFLITKPEETICFAKKGVSGHTRGDSVIHYYPKGILFENENNPIYRNSIMPQYAETQPKNRKETPHAKKIFEAIQLLKSQSCKSDYEYLNERVINFLKSATVVEIDKESPVLFAEPDFGVVRVMHVGRNRRVIVFTSRFIEKASVNEIAAMINSGERFLDEDVDIRDELQSKRSDLTINFFEDRKKRGEDSGLIDLGEFKKRLRAFVEEDTLAKYGEGMREAIKLEEEADSLLRSGELSGHRPDFDEARRINGSLLDIWEGAGVPIWAEKAYHNMKLASEGVQLADEGWAPIYCQRDLVTASLRYKLWDYFKGRGPGDEKREPGELEIYLTGIGYPRKLKRPEIDHAITLISYLPLKKTIDHALTAHKQAAVTSREISEIGEVERYVHGLLGKYEKEYGYLENLEPYEIDYSKDITPLEANLVTEKPAHTEKENSALRLNALNVAAWLKKQALRPARSSLTMGQRYNFVTFIYGRIAGMRHPLLKKERLYLRDALHAFADTRFELKEFEQSNNEIMGFNTYPRSDNARLDYFPTYLQLAIADLLPRTGLLSTEILDEIGADESLLYEYLFSVTILPYFTQEQSRYLRQELFPENYMRIENRRYGRRDASKLGMLMRKAADRHSVWRKCSLIAKRPNIFVRVLLGAISSLVFLYALSGHFTRNDIFAMLAVSVVGMAFIGNWLARHDGGAPTGYWWSEKKRRGLLCPLFSMRRVGDDGVGDLACLDKFIDYLAQEKYDMVFLLPTNQTSPNDPSPYNSISLFANNAIMHLPLDEVATDAGVKPDWTGASDKVDYAAVFAFKESILRREFSKAEGSPEFEDYAHNYEFREEIDNYALFHSLLDYHKGKYWRDWEEQYRDPKDPRNKEALELFKKEHNKEIEFYKYAQWLYYERALKTKRHADALNKFLIGDLPIYPSKNSADVWANQELFDLGKNAGAPADQFNSKGQDWGLPTYRWKEKRKDVLSYWKRRIAYAAQFYHGTRIDHLLGLCSEWLIDEGGKATDGKFYPASPNDMETQGREIITELASAARAHNMLLIGEDLGGRPENVIKMLIELSSKLPNLYLYNVVGWREPALATMPHILTVSETHDTEPTFAARYEKFSDRERKDTAKFANAHGISIDEQESPESVEEKIYEAVDRADFSCRSIQSKLNVSPKTSRINEPGKVHDRNWTWRMPMTLESLLAKAKPVTYKYGFHLGKEWLAGDGLPAVSLPASITRNDGQTDIIGDGMLVVSIYDHGEGAFRVTLNLAALLSHSIDFMMTKPVEGFGKALRLAEDGLTAKIEEYFKTNFSESKDKEIAQEFIRKISTNIGNKLIEAKAEYMKTLVKAQRPSFRIGRGIVNVDGEEVDVRNYIRTNRPQYWKEESFYAKIYFDLLKDAMEGYYKPKDYTFDNLLSDIDISKAYHVELGQDVTMVIAPQKSHPTAFLEIFVRNREVIGYGMSSIDSDGNAIVSFQIFSQYRSGKADLDRKKLYLDRLSALYILMERPIYFYVHSRQLSYTQIEEKSNAAMFYLKLGFIPLDQKAYVLAEKLSKKPRLAGEDIEAVARSVQAAKKGEDFLALDVGRTNVKTEGWPPAGNSGHIGETNFSFGEGVGLRHIQTDGIIAFYPKKMLKRGSAYETRIDEAALTDSKVETKNTKKIYKAIQYLKEVGRAYLKEAHDLKLDGHLERSEGFRKKGNRYLKRYKELKNDTTFIEVDTPTRLLISGVDTDGKFFYQLTHLGRGRKIIYIPKKFLDGLSIYPDWVMKIYRKLPGWLKRLLKLFKPFNREDIKELATILNHDQQELDYLYKDENQDIARTFKGVEGLLSEAHQKAKMDDPLGVMDAIEARMKRIGRKDRNILDLIRKDISKLEIAMERTQKIIEDQSGSVDAGYIFDRAVINMRIANAYEILEERAKALQYYMSARDSYINVQIGDTQNRPIFAQLRIVYLLAATGGYEELEKEFLNLLRGYIGRPLMAEERDTFEYYMGNIERYLHELSFLMLKHAQSSGKAEDEARALSAIEKMKDLTDRFIAGERKFEDIEENCKKLAGRVVEFSDSAVAEMKRLAGEIKAPREGSRKGPAARLSQVAAELAERLKVEAQSAKDLEVALMRSIANGDLPKYDMINAAAVISARAQLIKDDTDKETLDRYLRIISSSIERIENVVRILKGLDRIKTLKNKEGNDIVDMEGGETKPPHPATDMASGKEANGRADTVSEGDSTNPFIVGHITARDRPDGEGNAVELDAKRETVKYIRLDKTSPRAPPLEAAYKEDGTFAKIRAAKDPLLLRAILTKHSFSNLSPQEKEDLIGIVNNITLSLILGQTIIGKRANKDGTNLTVYAHVRTGYFKYKHGLEPTVWIGEIALDRLTVEKLAQLLLEECRHVLKLPLYLPDEGRWINLDGDMDKAKNPKEVIEHDKEFIQSIDLSPPTADELAVAARRHQAKPLHPATDMAMRKGQEMPDAAPKAGIEPQPGWHFRKPSHDQVMKPFYPEKEASRQLYLDPADVRIGRKVAEQYIDELIDSGKKFVVVTSDHVIDQMRAWKFPHLEELLKKSISVKSVHYGYADGRLGNYFDDVKKIEERPDLILGIGLGSVTDWSKMLGYKFSCDVALLPSALSTNAPFSANVIVRDEEAMGKNFEMYGYRTGAARTIVADLDFIAQNPRGNLSGIGDLMSSWVALLDWRLAIEHGKERKDERVYDDTLKLLNELNAASSYLSDNSLEGLEIAAKLNSETSRLMTVFGSGRPKAGSEHMVSDALEKVTRGRKILHGEQVGIATLLMAYLYGKVYPESINFDRLLEMAKKLGISLDLNKIGLARDDLIKALLAVEPRPGRFSYFDLYKVTPAIAREAVDKLFPTAPAPPAKPPHPATDMAMKQSGRWPLPASGRQYTLISPFRLWAHSLRQWEGENAIRYPYIATDHILLLILSSLFVMPFTFFWRRKWWHFNEARDSLRVAHNAWRYARNHSSVGIDDNLMSVALEFENKINDERSKMGDNSRSWVIRWVTDPLLLAKVDRENHYILMSIGWVAADESGDTRRKAHLVAILQKLKDAVKSLPQPVMPLTRSTPAETIHYKSKFETENPDEAQFFIAPQKPPAREADITTPGIDTTFSEIIDSFGNDRLLNALDIGTGEGEFCLNLAADYPNRFGKIIGIEKIKGRDNKSDVNSASVERITGVSLAQFAKNKAYQHYFDTIFINNSDSALWPECQKALATLLKPGGKVFVTAHWELFLTSPYEAFEDDHIIRGYLSEYADYTIRPIGFEAAIVTNLEGYPATIYQKVPGFIVARLKQDEVALGRGGTSTKGIGAAAAGEKFSDEEWARYKREMNDLRGIAGLAPLDDKGLRRLMNKLMATHDISLAEFIAKIRDKSPREITGELTAAVFQDISAPWLAQVKRRIDNLSKGRAVIDEKTKESLRRAKSERASEPDAAYIEIKDAIAALGTSVDSILQDEKKLKMFSEKNGLGSTELGRDLLGLFQRLLYKYFSSPDIFLTAGLIDSANGACEAYSTGSALYIYRGIANPKAKEYAGSAYLKEALLEALIDSVFDPDINVSNIKRDILDSERLISSTTSVRANRAKRSFRSKNPITADMVETCAKKFFAKNDKNISSINELSRELGMTYPVVWRWVQQYDGDLSLLGVDLKSGARRSRLPMARKPGPQTRRGADAAKPESPKRGGGIGGLGESLISGQRGLIGMPVGFKPFWQLLQLCMPGLFAVPPGRVPQGKPESQREDPGKFSMLVNPIEIEKYRIKNLGYYSSMIIKKLNLKKLVRWFRLLPIVEPLYQLIYFRNPIAQYSEDFVLLKRDDILTDYPDGVKEPRKYIALHRKYFNIDGPFMTLAYMPPGYQQPFHRHENVPDFTMYFAPTVVKYLSHGSESLLAVDSGEMLYVPVRLQHTLNNSSGVPSINITLRPALDHRIMLSQDDRSMIRAYGETPKILDGSVQVFDWGQISAYEIKTVGGFIYRAETVQLRKNSTVDLNPYKDKDDRWEEVLILLNPSTVYVSDGRTTYTMREGDILYAPRDRSYRILSVDGDAVIYRTFVIKHLSADKHYADDRRVDPSDLFSKDKDGRKPFWSMSLDEDIYRTSIAARDCLRIIHGRYGKDASCSYERLETALRDHETAVRYLGSERIEHFQIPEIAEFAGIELDKRSKMYYEESESLMKRILMANGLEEQRVLAHELQMTNPRRVAVPVLKWLANTAELGERRNAVYPKEAASAKSFLRNFVSWYFDELGGREVLEGYAESVMRKLRILAGNNIAAEDETRMVAILRGDELLGRVLEAHGLKVKRLLFTKFMAESFGLESPGGRPTMTPSGIISLKRYLDLQGIANDGAKYIIFLDVGSRGALYSLLKDSLADTGIDSGLLLIYHANYTDEQKDWAEGLNEDPVWSIAGKDALWWHAFMINDGLEHMHEIRAFDPISAADLVKPPMRDTPRKWYANMCEEAIQGFLGTLARSEKPTSPEETGLSSIVRSKALEDIGQIMDPQIIRDIIPSIEEMAARDSSPAIRSQAEMIVGVLRKRLGEIRGGKGSSYAKLDANQERAIARVNTHEDSVIAEILAAFLLGTSRADTIYALANYLFENYQDEYDARDIAYIAARSIVNRLTEPMAMAEDIPKIETSQPSFARMTRTEYLRKKHEKALERRAADLEKVRLAAAAIRARNMEPSVKASAAEAGITEKRVRAIGREALEMAGVVISNPLEQMKKAVVRRNEAKRRSLIEKIKEAVKNLGRGLSVKDVAKATNITKLQIYGLGRAILGSLGVTVGAHDLETFFAARKIYIEERFNKHLRAAEEALRWFLEHHPDQELNIGRLARLMTELKLDHFSPKGLWDWFNRNASRQEVEYILREMEKTKMLSRIRSAMASQPAGRPITEKELVQRIGVPRERFAAWKSRHHFNLNEYLASHPISAPEQHVAAVNASSEELRKIKDYIVERLGDAFGCITRAEEAMPDSGSKKSRMAEVRDLLDDAAEALSEIGNLLRLYNPSDDEKTEFRKLCGRFNALDARWKGLEEEASAGARHAKRKPKASPGMIGWLWKPIVTHLHKYLASKGLSDRWITPLGGLEELFYSGTLVSLFAWSLNALFGVDTAIGIGIGSGLSLLSFYDEHRKEIWRLTGGVLNTAPPALKEKLAILSLGLTLRLSYICLVSFMGVGLAIPSVVILHSAYNLAVSYLGSSQLYREDIRLNALEDGILLNLSDGRSIFIPYKSYNTTPLFVRQFNNLLQKYNIICFEHRGWDAIEFLDRNTDGTARLNLSNISERSIRDFIDELLPSRETAPFRPVLGMAQNEPAKVTQEVACYGTAADYMRNYGVTPDTLARIMADIWQEAVAKPGFDTLNPEVFESRFKEYLENYSAILAVDKKSGKVVGFITYSLNTTKKEGKLDYRAVLPTDQGQHIGTQLLDLAIMDLSHRGAKVFIFESVLSKKISHDNYIKRLRKGQIELLSFDPKNLIYRCRTISEIPVPALEKWRGAAKPESPKQGGGIGGLGASLISGQRELIGMPLAWKWLVMMLRMSMPGLFVEEPGKVPQGKPESSTQAGAGKIEADSLSRFEKVTEEKRADKRDVSKGDTQKGGGYSGPAGSPGINFESMVEEIRQKIPNASPEDLAAAMRERWGNVVMAEYPGSALASAVREYLASSAAEEEREAKGGRGETSEQRSTAEGTSAAYSDFTEALNALKNGNIKWDRTTKEMRLEFVRIMAKERGKGIGAINIVDMEDPLDAFDGKTLRGLLYKYRNKGRIQRLDSLNRLMQDLDITKVPITPYGSFAEALDIFKKGRIEWNRTTKDMRLEFIKIMAKELGKKPDAVTTIDILKPIDVFDRKTLRGLLSKYTDRDHIRTQDGLERLMQDLGIERVKERDAWEDKKEDWGEVCRLIRDIMNIEVSIGDVRTYLKKASLTKEMDIALGHEIVAGNSAAREAMIIAYEKDVSGIAAHTAHHNSDVTADELLSVGLEALMRLVEKYDPSRNVAFKTLLRGRRSAGRYIPGRIEGAMWDYIRRERRARRKDQKHEEQYAGPVEKMADYGHGGYMADISDYRRGEPSYDYSEDEDHVRKVLGAEVSERDVNIFIEHLRGKKNYEIAKGFKIGASRISQILTECKAILSGEKDAGTVLPTKPGKIVADKRDVSKGDTPSSPQPEPPLEGGMADLDTRVRWIAEANQGSGEALRNLIAHIEKAVLPERRADEIEYIRLQLTNSTMRDEFLRAVQSVSSADTVKIETFPLLSIFGQSTDPKTLLPIKEICELLKIPEDDITINIDAYSNERIKIFLLRKKSNDRLLVSLAIESRNKLEVDLINPDLPQEVRDIIWNRNSSYENIGSGRVRNSKRRIYRDLNRIAVITDYKIWQSDLRGHGIGNAWYMNHVEPYLKKCGFRIIAAHGSCLADTEGFWAKQGFSDAFTTNSIDDADDVQHSINFKRLQDIDGDRLPYLPSDEGAIPAAAAQPGKIGTAPISSAAKTPVAEPIPAAAQEASGALEGGKNAASIDDLIDIMQSTARLPEHIRNADNRKRLFDFTLAAYRILRNTGLLEGCTILYPAGGIDILPATCGVPTVILDNKVVGARWDLRELSLDFIKEMSPDLDTVEFKNSNLIMYEAGDAMEGDVLARAKARVKTPKAAVFLKCASEYIFRGTVNTTNRQALDAYRKFIDIVIEKIAPEKFIIMNHGDALDIEAYLIQKGYEIETGWLDDTASSALNEALLSMRDQSPMNAAGFNLVKFTAPTALVVFRRKAQEPLTVPDRNADKSAQGASPGAPIINAPQTWYGPGTAVYDGWRIAYEENRLSGKQNELSMNMESLLGHIEGNKGSIGGSIMLNLASGPAPLAHFTARDIQVINIDNFPAAYQYSQGTELIHENLLNLSGIAHRVRSEKKRPIRFTALCTNMLHQLKFYAPQYKGNMPVDEYVRKILKDAWDALESDNSYFIITEPGCADYLEWINIFSDSLGEMMVIGDSGNFQTIKAIVFCKSVKSGTLSKITSEVSPVSSQGGTGLSSEMKTSLDSVRKVEELDKLGLFETQVAEPIPAAAKLPVARFIYDTEEGSFIEIDQNGKIIRFVKRSRNSKEEILKMWRKEEADELKIRAIDLALQLLLAAPLTAQPFSEVAGVNSGKMGQSPSGTVPIFPAPAIDYVEELKKIIRTDVASIVPVAEIPENMNGKGLILFADAILDHGAVIDLKQTLMKTNRLDGATMIIHEKRPGVGELLRQVIDESNKGVRVIVIDEAALSTIAGTEARIDEAKALEGLIRFAAQKVGNNNVAGVIKGRRPDDDSATEDTVNEVLDNLKIPVVNFESDNGIYSFAEALNMLIKAKNDYVPGVKGYKWYQKLPPITREDIQKIYDKYKSLLEPALSA